MKALILAAGLGTRLKPLTDHIPKPLLSVGNQPLLSYHLQSLAAAGCTEILINSHYLAQQISDFVSSYKGPIKISVIYESELLGSAGTLSLNRNFFAQDEDFLVVYGDNFTNIDYNKLWCYHKQQASIATIACYFETNPSEKGVVNYNSDRRLVSFTEKPGPTALATYVNGGLYVFNRRIFRYLLPTFSSPYDISKDLFSQYLLDNELVKVYEMIEPLLDIGNLENYQRANLLSKELFK